MAQELKAGYIDDFYCEFYESGMPMAYLKDEVDALLAEKDAEIARLKDKLQAAEKLTAIGDWNRLCMKYNKLIELKKDFCEKFKDIELEADK